MKLFIHCVLTIFSLFCLRFQFLARADSNIRLTIKKSKLCVNENDKVNFTCALRRRSVNKTKTLWNELWNISWHSEGKISEQNSSIIFQNNTVIVSSLTIYVNWSKDKVLACFAAFKKGDLIGYSINTSVVVSARPRRTRIIGARLIEVSDVIKVVEIYWKQADDITYSLNYTSDLHDAVDKSIDKIECYYRTRDVYRVPNTTGRICQASIKFIGTVLQYVEYTAKLITKRGQCENSGPKRKFQLMYFSGVKDPGPNKYDLVIIPHAVSMFTVRVAKQRQVQLAWANLENLMAVREYLLMYNCLEWKVKERYLYGATNVTLVSTDFPVYRPNSICRFCIKARLKASEVYSEPVCRHTRLHEEPPSEPPTMTCDGNECVTSSDGRFRNLTVTWMLPPREAWNGNLTHVAVTYRRDGNGSIYKRIVERNLTKGFIVIPKLAQNHSYVVKMAACNREGCSRYGNTSVIPAFLETQRNQKAKSSDDDNFWAIVGPVLAVVVIVLGAALTVGCVKQAKRKRKEKQQGLPKLKEPNNYDNISGEQVASKDYDSIIGSDGESTVEIVYGEDNMGSDAFLETSL